ncbi:MAG: DNRLRE domain-containing protein [Anaerolineales bacterium]|jgi:hypothetical protein
MKNVTQRIIAAVIYIIVLSGFVLISSGFSYHRIQETVETSMLLSDVTGSADDHIYLPMVLTGINRESIYRINVPYFNGEIKTNETAIAWFGQVTPNDNYADVRLGYNDVELYVDINIFDRRLWYDSTPSLAGLTEWDAVSVYIDLDGDVGDGPDFNSYKFVGQLNWWEDRNNWQVAYQGNGSGWEVTSISFTTSSVWRGNAPNDDVSDKGWRMKFHIPFTSLKLAGSPSQGNVWGIAIVMHDRDDELGDYLTNKSWPESIDTNRPGTWGRIEFGFPTYTPPVATLGGEVVIKQGLNGTQVVDAHVGGHTTCGDGLEPYFSNWGNANYADYKQINIQNQTDVSDWPCFSKYYITFPLDTLPPGKVILSASLLMYQFGNAGVGYEPPPQPSLIQVLVVQGNWEESTLTWNNAPIAQENVSQAWVGLIEEPPEWPGIPIEWDVSRAVAEAYASNEPLRLALYSADFARHSGKYFYSSDAGEAARPSLTVFWGD